MSDIDMNSDNAASDETQGSCRPDERQERLAAASVPPEGRDSAHVDGARLPHEDGARLPFVGVQAGEKKKKLPDFVQLFCRVVFHNYANFRGYASRREFLLFALFHILVNALLVGLMLIPGFLLPGIGLLLFWDLLIIVPLSALFVRRLHDVGRSGWWWGVTLICGFAAGGVAGGGIAETYLRAEFEAEAGLRELDDEIALLNLLIRMQESRLDSINALCLAWGYDELTYEFLFGGDEEETQLPSEQEGEQTSCPPSSPWQELCDAASGCLESPAGLASAWIAGFLCVVYYILTCICTYFALLAGRTRSASSAGESQAGD